MEPRHEGVAAAVAKLLMEDLKAVINGLPETLQASVPEGLHDEMRTLGEEDTTGKADD